MRRHCPEGQNGRKRSQRRLVICSGCRKTDKSETQQRAGLSSQGFISRHFTVKPRYVVETATFERRIW